VLFWLLLTEEAYSHGELQTKYWSKLILIAQLTKAIFYITKS
jgi:hypothetical protein